MSRKIILTAALPYANGNIHVGHMMEYLMADIWVRFQKQFGNDCLYICGADTHGTPIMIEARKQGITPEQLIEGKYKEHSQVFADFQVQFSNFSSTNSEENRILCEAIFKKAQEKGHILEKPVEQLYCSHDKMFLPDRFVKGTCPKCGALDQYGDSCDVCGATYSPTEMKDAACSVCGTTPIKKTTQHLFFQLEHFRTFLMEWLPKHTAPEVANKMLEWFNEPLRNWDITRDNPYFGFEIPGYPGKFFYVWVDAPMGYVSSTKEYCQKHGLDFDSYWKSEKSEVYHLIGKDITYFHTLFWPALLKTADLRTPTQVWAHGHLLVNGKKMSKSKGTMIPARTYLDHLNPAYLRYYFASKMNSTMDDLDLNLDDFVQRVNSDLVGKITNLGSRGAQMLKKRLDGKLCPMDKEGQAVFEKAAAKAEMIAEFFEKRDFSKAISEIRGIADDANRYFDEKAPWKKIETDPEEVRKVLTSTLNIFKAIAIYLKPVLPDYTAKVEKLFAAKSEWNWQSAKTAITQGEIGDYEHLMQRIEADAVKNLIAATQPAEPPPTPATDAKKKSSTSAASANPPAEIEMDDFSKVDLRIAKIIKAESVPEADKLLKLTVDVGSLGQKTIFAGIKSAYKPEALEGRLTMIVANLKPRKMKFGLSEGMVLAAGGGGSELFILSPDSGAKPGDKVK